MACQALGRCRICAQKHNIAVFGGEEAQHFFIEKAKLKLIILNTVCIVCIGKIERFVKKMDLDMVFNDYIKHEDADDPADESGVRRNETQKSNEKGADNSSGPSMAMGVDLPDENSRDSKASNASYNSCASRSDVAKTDMQPQCSGDSQATVDTPHHLSKQKIGQKKSATEDASNEPDRKRPRNISKKNLAQEVVERNSEDDVTPLSSLSSVTKIAVTDFGPSESPSNVKKSGRFLRCDFCKKEFTHAGDLNKHRRKHTGEKPYECNQCQRKFAHASNLARHQRVHSGERPFACPKCNRTFTRRDKLAIHVNAGRCQIDTTDTNSTELTIRSEQTKT